ncbi:hypothetical protein [Alloactinosynnema sp. L-07]|uniref:hypothetical protein n=1 Tax=Alloactinosynnema sp. L-07 TaxID=1653480 RepID=UPI00065F095E|nr:hypothetical protein [Alloactinosynnema sp. L-07]CRK55983.1 hypothetical protein [Alloactinosynnema sp. L-07]
MSTFLHTVQRKRWPRLVAAFLAFPPAGLLGLAAAGGRVDDPVAALVGGAVTGLVIGAAQALAGGLPQLWTVATSAGMAAGLTVGATAVGFGTGLGDLVVQGAITGLVVGPAQALVLSGRGRVIWVIAAPALWALGWLVTTLAGVDVSRQCTVFGGSGALVHSALAGLLLIRIEK